MHFFTHVTSWISCIFLTWACKPFNDLLANAKPLSLTIKAIPKKTKGRKKKEKKKKRRRRRYSTVWSSSTMACMPISGRCIIFKKFHAWRNARACIKCSSWIVKEDGQDNTLHANQIHAYFLWPYMLGNFFDLSSFFDL